MYHSEQLRTSRFAISCKVKIIIGKRCVESLHFDEIYISGAKLKHFAVICKHFAEKFASEPPNWKHKVSEDPKRIVVFEHFLYLLLDEFLIAASVLRQQPRSLLIVGHCSLRVALRL